MGVHRSHVKSFLKRMGVPLKLQGFKFIKRHSRVAFSIFHRNSIGFPGFPYFFKHFRTSLSRDFELHNAFEKRRRSHGLGSSIGVGVVLVVRPTPSDSAPGSSPPENAGLHQRFQGLEMVGLCVQTRFK